MFLDLVKLELLKVMLSKRLILAMLIVVFIAGVGTWDKWQRQAEWNKYLEISKYNFRQGMEYLPKQIAELERINDRTPEQEKILERLKENLQQLKSEKDPEPLDVNTFDSTIGFFTGIGQFFLLLLVLLLTGDAFSSEFALGTIRLVFASVTRRGKFWSAKLVSGALMVLFLVLASASIAFLAGGIVLGFEGWDQPVQYIKGGSLAKGEFLFLSMGLQTVVMLVVMLMGSVFSVLFQSGIVPVVASIAIVFTGVIIRNEEDGS